MFKWKSLELSQKKKKEINPEPAKKHSEEQ